MKGSAIALLFVGRRDEEFGNRSTHVGGGNEGFGNRGSATAFVVIRGKGWRQFFCWFFYFI